MQRLHYNILKTPYIFQQLYINYSKCLKYIYHCFLNNQALSNSLNKTLNFKYLVVYLKFIQFKSSHWSYSIKKLFLKNSQNPKEKIYVRVSFFNKVADLKMQFY